MKASNFIVIVLLLVFVLFGCAGKKQTGGELSDEELKEIEDELGEEGAIDESADREVESDLGELSGEEDELKEIESDEFDESFSSDEEFGAEDSLNKDVDQGLDF